jgi:hypothetical protein
VSGSVVPSNIFEEQAQFIAMGLGTRLRIGLVVFKADTFSGSCM